MRVQTKDDVSFNGVHVEVLYGMSKLAQLFAVKEYGPFTVTSVLDGVHKPNSKHYEGLAFDIRRWNIPEEKFSSCIGYIKVVLGNSWDVIVEKTHIHCEYDPK